MEAAGGLDCGLALDERIRGFCAAGLARTSRGASTVTGGNDWAAVCAFIVEGIVESALHSASVLAPLRA